MVHNKPKTLFQAFLLLFALVLVLALIIWAIMNLPKSEVEEVTYPRIVESGLFEIRFEEGYKPEYRGMTFFINTDLGHTSYIESRNTVRVGYRKKEELERELADKIQEIIPITTYEVSSGCFARVDEISLSTDSELTIEGAKELARSVGGELMYFGGGLFINIWVPSRTIIELQEFVQRIEDQNNKHIKTVSTKICSFNFGLQR